MNHCFNILNLTSKKTFNNIDKIITEHRTEYLIKYPKEFLILEGILMHLLNIGSRNKISTKLQKKNIVNAVNKFLGTKIDQFSHGDNLEKFLQKVSVDELQNLLSKIIIDLIKSKKIKRKDLLFGKHYMIAIDMTQTQTFKSNEINGKKIPGLLWQTNNGKTTWSRKIVEAKLLLFNKLSIPIMTEFVRNDDSVDGEFKKQDCELKAAYRLIERLKKLFKRLDICLLLDGLYPNKTIFKKCEEFNWKFIISFKETKLPNIFKNFKESKKLNLHTEKRKIVRFNMDQRFKFAEAEYDTHILTIIEMKEYIQNEGIKYYNTFITNIEVEKTNVYNIGRAGRLRWKIEHAFNRQKNTAFNLEHTFSINENASQCYHILLQIADLILQFMLYTFTDNGENIVYKIYDSLKEFMIGIYESFKYETSNIKKYFLRKHLILIPPKP